MTANERLEKLLNRAGQTISDLPTWGGDMQKLGRAKREALTEMGERWTDSQTVSADEMPLLEYILRLTDIIDRMEWALANVIGERDRMIKEYAGCNQCVYLPVDAGDEPCVRCGSGKPFWEFAGVPEDWRADE